MKTGHCIICHKDNVELTDEHVIPDVLGGYYHINSVCKTCNSKLGENVDIKLSGHWLMQGERNVHRLEGKKHNIPNPLVGDGALEDGTKVRIEENKAGEVVPYILPSSPKIDKNGITITVDARDEKLADKMVKKVLKKMGLKDGEYELHPTKTEHTIEQPWIKQEVSMDVSDYRIGLLKIAYEFAVDKIPAYYNDPKARLYSKILEDGAIDRLNEVDFQGDAFLSASLKPFDDYIEYSRPKRHFLFLINSGGKLQCIVKLFDIICQNVVLSDREYPEIGPSYLAVNDFGNSECKFYSVEELVNATCTLKNRGARFSDEDNKLLEKVSDGANGSLQLGFACDDHRDNILFDKDCNELTTQTSLINQLEASNCKKTENTADGIRDTYTVLAGLYLKLMPSGILIHPVEFVYETTIQKL